MRIKQVYDLRSDSTGCGAIQLLSNGFDFQVKYEYGSSLGSFVETIIFSDVVAQRFLDEHHVDIGGSAYNAAVRYDTVVQVEPSSWLDEVKLLEYGGIDNFRLKNCIHFSVIFSNCGQLDVLAKSFDIVSNQPGTLITEFSGER